MLTIDSMVNKYSEFKASTGWTIAEIDFLTMKKFTLLLALIIFIPAYPATLLSDEKLNIQEKIAIETDYKLDVWVNKLAKMENCPKQGMIDRNNRLSYGALCFQEKTFIYYVKKFNLLPAAEDNEIMNMIDDDKFQKELTKRIILDNPNNFKHWYTSIIKRGLGKPPVI